MQALFIIFPWLGLFSKTWHYLKNSQCRFWNLIFFLILLRIHVMCMYVKGMYISSVCSCLEDRFIFKWQYSETIAELEVILQYVGMTRHETKQMPKYCDWCKHVMGNSTLRTLHSETKMIIESFYHFFTQETEELKLGY